MERKKDNKILAIKFSACFNGFYEFAQKNNSISNRLAKRGVEHAEDFSPPLSELMSLQWETVGYYYYVVLYNLFCTGLVFNEFTVL